MNSEVYQFSIIIPVYNAEKIITRCLESLARQTFRDFEVVMVDDGSKDRSAAVIESFLSVHNDISAQLLRQQNAGAGVARNVGICHSKGEYIVFLDSDDYVEDDYLECVNEKIDSEKADVVFIDIIREKEGGAVIRHEDMSRFASLGKERLIRWQLTGKTPWGGCRKVVRSSIIKNNNLTYAPIKVGEESIFSFRILQIADKIAFQPKAIYHYVETDTSLTAHDNVSNPQSVFAYISNYILESPYKTDFEPTVNALGVTTVAILVNILATDLNFWDAVRESRKYVKKYRDSIKGEIDFDALERRVLYCYPFMRIGIVSPIIIGSYFQKIIKKIKQH